MTAARPSGLGRPVAYLVVTDGTPVYDKHGERVGVVEHVLADEDLDIFHGLVVHPSAPRPVHPGRPAESPLEKRLRHAWDWITGNR